MLWELISLWPVFVLSFLTYCVLGWAAVSGEEAFNRWRGEPPPKPKPKPYRVTIQDGEGWPLRSYSLPADAAGRLLQDLERDRDRDKPA